MSGLPRVRPFRGDQVAAGVVVLVVLVWLLRVRFDADWAAGVHVVYVLAAVLFTGALAVLAGPEAEEATPRAYMSVLYLATAALTVALGASVQEAVDADAGGATQLLCLTAPLALVGAWFAIARHSAASLLVAAVAAAVALLALADVLTELRPSGARWLLLALFAGFVLGAVAQRDRRPRHAVALADAAGLAALGIAVTLAGPTLTFGGLGADGGGGRTAWELLVLAAGFGSVAYSGIDRQPGPAYIGVLDLAAFVFLAQDEGGLVGWPLALALGAGALLVIGLRPTTPAPPPPDADVPPAPTAPLRPGSR